ATRAGFLRRAPAPSCVGPMVRSDNGEARKCSREAVCHGVQARERSRKGVASKNTITTRKMPRLERPGTPVRPIHPGPGSSKRALTRADPSLGAYRDSSTAQAPVLFQLLEAAAARQGALPHSVLSLVRAAVASSP